MLNLKDHIRTVPDFPKAGIQFYDIATLLAHGPALQQTISQMAALIRPHQPTLLAAIDARGFLLAAPLAVALGVGLLLVRKAGKLPGQTTATSYALEYGHSTLEIQPDLLPAGARIVLVDDVLATGGTAAAALHLLQQAGASKGASVQAAAFLLELTFLGGAAKLPVPSTSLLQYTS